MKWRRGILVGGLIVVGVVIGVSVSGRKEPSYKGKSLSSWLRICRATIVFEDERYEAEQAVRHIGTNAVPYLLADLDYQPPWWFGKLAVVLDKPGRPAWFNQFLADHDRNGQAQVGFSILGTNAASAIPELLRRLDSPDPTDATIALAHIGRAALPWLIGTMTNEASSTLRRNLAAQAIGQMGTNASDATRVLVWCVYEHPNLDEAAWALGRVAINAEEAVPALTNALRSELSGMRLAATMALTHLGSRAASAEPALEAILNDEDVTVRVEVTNALESVRGRGYVSE